jgi:hypothetical protein
MEGEHEGALGRMGVRAGSLNVMQEIGARIQMESIIVVKEESMRTLVHLILASEHEDLGNAVQSLQLGMESARELSDMFWSSAHCVALTTRRLRNLEVPGISDPVPASLLAIVASTSETTLTSLNISLDADTKLALIYIHHFINLQRLRIHFRHSAPAGLQLSQPLSLPYVHNCAFLWQELDSPALLEWIAKCRFREDCEFSLEPSSLSEAESEELNPLFESHRSELVSFFLIDDYCGISPASTIFQHTQRVDFGQYLFPPAEIFSAAHLPRDVWFVYNPFTKPLHRLREIADAVLSSGCTHDLRIHIYCWQMEEEEIEMFLEVLEELSGQLQAQGVAFIGVIED